MNCEVETPVAELCVTIGTGHRYATFLLAVLTPGHFLVTYSNITLRMATARRKASATGSATGSATRSAKKPRVAWASPNVGESETAKREGLNNIQFRQLVSNPGLTINQLTKLRIEAGNRGQQNVVNNINRRIENKISQGATKRKTSPSLVATMAKKPKTIKNIKSAMRKQGTAVSTARKPGGNRQNSGEAGVDK